MDLSDACGLCLNSTSERLLPVTDSLRKKYMEIMNSDWMEASNADENKRIPKGVCGPCLLDLNKFYTYFRNLKQKQEELREYMKMQFIGEKAEQFIDEKTLIEAAGSQPESVTQENPVEFQEEFEESDQELDMESDVKNEETTEDREIYYEEQHEDEQIAYGYAPEDAMTSDAEEFDSNHLEYTEEVEEEEMETELEEDDFHIKLVGEDDGEYNFDDAIMIDDTPLIPKPKRKYERQVNSSEKSFKCWIKNCLSAFSNRQTMKKHMLQAHTILVNKSMCMICGLSYEKYPEYLAHVKGHTRKFECKVCMSTFTSLEVLSGHMKRSHTKKDNEQRIYACAICDAKFKRKEHVNSHVIYKHSDNSARKFPCKSCASKFLTLQDLKNHEKSHDQVMIHCNYCENEYRDRKSIVRHCLKIHHTTKIYKCNCDMGFENFRDMQLHKKSCSLTTPDMHDKCKIVDANRKASEAIVKRINRN